MGRNGDAVLCVAFETHSRMPIYTEKLLRAHTRTGGMLSYLSSGSAKGHGYNNKRHIRSSVVPFKTNSCKNNSPVTRCSQRCTAPVESLFLMHSPHSIPFLVNRGLCINLQAVFSKLALFSQPPAIVHKEERGGTKDSGNRS